MVTLEELSFPSTPSASYVEKSIILYSLKFIANEHNPNQLFSNETKKQKYIMVYYNERKNRKEVQANQYSPSLVEYGGVKYYEYLFEIESFDFPVGLIHLAAEAFDVHGNFKPVRDTLRIVSL